MTSTSHWPACTYRCSFCAMSSKQVRKLIAGPGVYICDTCIARSVELLDEKSTVPKLRPWEIEYSLDDVLEAPPQAASAAGQADEHLRNWVRKARSLRATWERIGEALGMTQQSAWERLSRSERA